MLVTVRPQSFLKDVRLATRRRQSGKSSASADFRVRILDQCAQTPSYSKTNDDFKSFLFFRKQGERLVTIVC